MAGTIGEGTAEESNGLFFLPCTGYTKQFPWIAGVRLGNAAWTYSISNNGSIEEQVKHLSPVIVKVEFVLSLGKE